MAHLELAQAGIRFYSKLVSEEGLRVKDTEIQTNLTSSAAGDGFSMCEEYFKAISPPSSIQQDGQGK